MMTRIYLADDHPSLREGLKKILSRHPDLEVVGEASSWSWLLEDPALDGSDVLLLDLDMPGSDLVRGFERLSHHPHVAILVFTMHPAEDYALRCLDLGAAGFLGKSSSPGEIVHAIRRVVEWGRYVPPEVSALITDGPGSDGAGGPPHRDLSSREFQVLQLSVQGLAVKRIASELELSPKTVSTYRARIREKLEVDSFAGAIRYAVEHALFP
jgi:DNA-binding NarL/FixJ family response regulator